MSQSNSVARHFACSPSALRLRLAEQNFWARRGARRGVYACSRDRCHPRTSTKAEVALQVIYVPHHTDSDTCDNGLTPSRALPLKLRCFFTLQVLLDNFMTGNLQSISTHKSPLSMMLAPLSTTLAPLFMTRHSDLLSCPFTGFFKYNTEHIQIKRDRWCVMMHPVVVTHIARSHQPPSFPAIPESYCFNVYIHSFLPTSVTCKFRPSNAGVLPAE